MNKKIKLEEYIDVITDQLQNDGYFTFLPTGNSMEPFITNHDPVTICKAENLKKYDIVLCKNNQGKFILHRIIKIINQNDFYIRGDNQLLVEHITSNQLIIGKVSYYVHKNKTIKRFNTLKVKIWNSNVNLRQIRRILILKFRTNM